MIAEISASNKPSTNHPVALTKMNNNGPRQEPSISDAGRRVSEVKEAAAEELGFISSLKWVLFLRLLRRRGRRGKGFVGSRSQIGAGGRRVLIFPNSQ